MPPKLTLLPPTQAGSAEALLRILVPIAIRLAQKSMVGSKQAA